MCVTVRRKVGKDQRWEASERDIIFDKWKIKSTSPLLNTYCSFQHQECNFLLKIIGNMREHGEQHSHDADINSGTATTNMFALVKDLLKHTWKSESLIWVYLFTR